MATKCTACGSASWWWNAFSMQNHCIQCGAAIKTYSDDSPPSTIKIIPEVKCECGGDKFGGGSHSDWCPKGNK